MESVVVYNILWAKSRRLRVKYTVSYCTLWITGSILANILQRRLIPPKTQQELLKGYDIITKQNYFAHKDQIVVQHTGSPWEPRPQA